MLMKLLIPLLIMPLLKLDQLKKGATGYIHHISHPTRPIPLRLLEMGFLKGAWIEVVHENPFGGDPIAVRIRGSLIALRRHEAQFIEVCTSP